MDTFLWRSLLWAPFLQRGGTIACSETDSNLTYHKVDWKSLVFYFKIRRWEAACWQSSKNVHAGYQWKWTSMWTTGLPESLTPAKQNLYPLQLVVLLKYFPTQAIVMVSKAARWDQSTRVCAQSIVTRKYAMRITGFSALLTWLHLSGDTWSTISDTWFSMYVLNVQGFSVNQLKTLVLSIQA